MRGSGVRFVSAPKDAERSFSLFSLFFVPRLTLSFAAFPLPLAFSFFQCHLAASVSSDQRECDLVRMLNDRIIGLNMLDGLSPTIGRSGFGDSSSDPA